MHAIGALIDACYPREMPSCWRRIYLVATASNPKSRYQTVQELRKAVNMRHWRKVLFSVVAVILVGALTFMIANSVRKRSAVERMPHRFHEKGF